MGNIVNIDTYRGLSNEDVQRMVSMGNDKYYSVFGPEQKEGEPETVTLRRQMDNLNISLVAKGFTQEKYESRDPEDSAFVTRRASEEYMRYVELQQQYLDAEKREDEQYEKLIGMSPSDHNDLLLRNWEMQNKEGDN